VRIQGCRRILNALGLRGTGVCWVRGDTCESWWPDGVLRRSELCNTNVDTRGRAATTEVELPARGILANRRSSRFSPDEQARVEFSFTSGGSLKKSSTGSDLRADRLSRTTCIGLTPAGSSSS
jgi:hypothetical protein